MLAAEVTSGSKGRLLPWCVRNSQSLDKSIKSTNFINTFIPGMLLKRVQRPLGKFSFPGRGGNDLLEFA